jgi:hypothetical protein
LREAPQLGKEARDTPERAVRTHARAQREVFESVGVPRDRTQCLEVAALDGDATKPVAWEIANAHTHTHTRARGRVTRDERDPGRQGKKEQGKH